MKIYKLASMLVFALLLAGMATGFGYSQASTYTYRETHPVELDVFVDCAAGGTGEIVHLTGSLQNIFHVTDDPTGGQLVQFMAHPQGISGYGMLTGDKYQGTGITRDVLHTSGLSYGVEYTFVNNYRIIGQGSGNNLMIQDIFHYTITAPGEITAWMEHSSETCQ